MMNLLEEGQQTALLAQQVQIQQRRVKPSSQKLRKADGIGASQERLEGLNQAARSSSRKCARMQSSITVVNLQMTHRRGSKGGSKRDTLEVDHDIPNLLFVRHLSCGVAGDFK